VACLEHVPNLENQIKELKRLLKPNGTLIVAVPNFKSSMQNITEVFNAYDVPFILAFFENSYKKCFSKRRMKLVKVLPMKFDSFM
jgi:2-polyprenyl-3-methyl-5-hydroxy-6-metoxy-1,4-benzoquinol methylase